MQQQKRVFLRHPHRLPVYYRCCSTQSGNRPGARVGLGVAFACNERLAPATLINLTIRALNRSYHFPAMVSWCRTRAEGYEAGVNFLNEDDTFRARMVEQVCHIEDYRAKVKEEEGRELTRDAAAREWIAKYAGNFPDHGYTGTE